MGFAEELRRRFDATVEARLAEPGVRAAPAAWRFQLPPPVAATLVAIAEAEGALDEGVTRYYCDHQPSARIDQLLRDPSPLAWHPLAPARQPRLAEALHGVARELARQGLAWNTLTGTAGVDELIARRGTPAELQAHALFGGGAPILGVGPGDRERLVAEAARGADAALDLRLSGFLVHELCHGIPRAHTGVPAPWTLLEAGALHLGYAARPAHVFPDEEGEALPAVAGFVMIGEVFARRFGAAALYRLSLGATLADAIGEGAAEQLSRAALADWRRARTAPFVVHALDAAAWAQRIDVAAGGGWRDLAPTDADLAMLEAAVRAMFHHHRAEPSLVALPSDPPGQRLFLDARAATLSALPRPDGCFAEPASWVVSPPLARRLLERGAELVVIEDATRARRGEVVRALEDLAASDRALPREVTLSVAGRPTVRLCPLTDGAGRELARSAALAAAHELGLFAAPIAHPPPRLRALLDVLACEGLFVRTPDGFVACGSPPPPPAPAPIAREGWGRLADVIRDDVPLDIDDASPTYHAHLRAVAAPAAAELAARFAIGGDLVLDLGCGAGAYGEAYLAASPATRVCFVDREPVLALARRALVHHGERASFVAGELECTPDGEPASLAILANVLHLHGPATAAQIVARAARRLAPGGRLVVKDFLVQADRRGPPAGLLFALNMAVYTDDGDAHDRDAIAEWLAAAGLVDVDACELACDPEAVVIHGRRPRT